MRAKQLLVSVLLLGSASTLWAQSTSEEYSQFEGSLKARIFTDFTHGLFENRDITEFNIKRAVFGYEATFGKGFSADLEIDFASTESDTGEVEYATYVRNAELIWNVGDFELDFGVITPKIFNFVEDFWGYRYIVKSSMDEYKFGHSRDLGLSLTYTPSDIVSLDGSILNGDGYKYFQTHNNLKYGVGATLQPLNGLFVRLYAESYDHNNSVQGGDNQYVVAGFLGYQNSQLSVGAEYNKLWNSEFIVGNDESIISVYGRYALSDDSSLFARFDSLCSSKSWSGGKGRYQDAYYIGYEYQPIKYVRIAPMLSYKVGDDEVGSPYVGFFMELRY